MAGVEYGLYSFSPRLALKRELLPLTISALPSESLPEFRIQYGWPTAQPPAAGECLQQGTDLSLMPSQDN